MGFNRMRVMQISELLNEENVVVDFIAEEKESAISKLVDVISSNSKVEDVESVREAVFEREKLMSTGVGKGLALPHAKTTGVREIVAALAVTSSPIEFHAVDNEPVRIIFLLVGPPDSKSNHVRVLSRISRLMNLKEVRDGVIASKSPTELLQFINKYEKQLFPL